MVPCTHYRVASFSFAFCALGCKCCRVRILGAEQESLGCGPLVSWYRSQGQDHQHAGSCTAPRRGRAAGVVPAGQNKTVYHSSGFPSQMESYTIASRSVQSELFVSEVGWEGRCPVPGSLPSARSSGGDGRGQRAEEKQRRAACRLRASCGAAARRKGKTRFGESSSILCCRMQSCRKKRDPWRSRAQNVLKKK